MKIIIPIVIPLSIVIPAIVLVQECRIVVSPVVPVPAIIVSVPNKLSVSIFDKLSVWDSDCISDFCNCKNAFNFITFIVC
jgi:hypothetical protein